MVHGAPAMLQVEAFYDGGVATALFDMPVLLAFTMGWVVHDIAGHVWHGVCGARVLQLKHLQTSAS